MPIENKQVSLGKGRTSVLLFFIYLLCLKVKIANFLKQKDRKRPLRFLLFCQILLGLQRLIYPRSSYTIIISLNQGGQYV